MTAMQLQSFTPGTYIEIDDVMKGFRKLALVTEGGDMYFDELGPTHTPFPIYAKCNPTDVGNPLTWGLELADNPAESRQYHALLDRLNDTNLDTITKARALLWARRNRVYDYTRSLAESQAENGKVADSRAMLDRLCQKAASASDGHA